MDIGYVLGGSAVFTTSNLESPKIRAFTDNGHVCIYVSIRAVVNDLNVD